MCNLGRWSGERPKRLHTYGSRRVGKSCPTRSAKNQNVILGRSKRRKKHGESDLRLAVTSSDRSDISWQRCGGRSEQQMTARIKYPMSSRSGTIPIVCSLPAPAATGAGTFLRPLMPPELPIIASGTQAPTTPQISPEVAEALAALLWPRIDHDSYGWKLPNGDKPQSSREQLDRTFAARLATVGKFQIGRAHV